MNVLTVAEVKALAAERQPPCISIFMPTERRGTDNDGNDIRFKGLLRQAERQLADSGLKERAINAFLGQAWHLQEDKLYWSHMSEGFACFIAQDFLRTFRVPVPFREVVTLNRRFHLKPLLEPLSMDGHFYILALSEKHNRLLYCSRYDCWPMQVADMPPNMEYTLRFDEHENVLQQHAGTRAAGVGRPSQVFHGQGGEKDLELTNRLRYFQEIAHALHKALRDEKAPLVLATVVEEQALYRQASEYAHIAEDFIAGNPETTKDEELHKRGWRIVEPIFLRCRQEALARFEEAKAHRQGLTEVADVVRAAHDGLIDQLFVSLGREVWGTYDPESRDVAIHEARQAGDDDLLDLAALKALTAGGVVWAVQPEEMPLRTAAAAVLRYPVPG